ncbi:hypothetical protein SL1157_0382 [Ruegeria lacuscaerulensis ITI-1157]|nr:hypothetical protein SL1157_0382 [Ruegeria lacuscaerulensis ITI-1157]SHI32908.1 hypothetical protein SAMN05444404_0001 [Ruegeria lacuscaerulensis ITI-1157]
MGPKVFLSLSFVDDDLVDRVYRKLPAGLAFFYKKSFENSASLISEMQTGVSESKIFVLFASREAMESGGVQFEINEAQRKTISDFGYRVLVYPTSSKVSHSDLPSWLQPYWMPRAGYSANDIARHITQILIDEYRTDIFGGDQVIGRGRSNDDLSASVAEHISRHQKNPKVIILSGVRGVGRKTFAQYYAKNSLSYLGNAPYGPRISLADHADIADLYRSVLTEVSDVISQESFEREMDAFTALEMTEQAKNLASKLSYFSDLSQVVVIESSRGFLEDKGGSKDWVLPLFDFLSDDSIIFLISSRLIPQEELAGRNSVVQYRVPELSDKDTRTLMVMTAQYLGVPDYSVSDDLVVAIGGHPDIARQAVLLSKVHGNDFFSRDPKKLYDVQNTILSESIAEDYLEQRDIEILSLLSWVPALPNDLLWRTIKKLGRSQEEFSESFENMVHACLIVPLGSRVSISPAIRMPFRRLHPSTDELVTAFSKVLRDEWQRGVDADEFRADLFEAFVFMHSLEGSALPKELERLVTPGMLHDVVRQNYNLGKDKYDTNTLKKAIEWGKMASGMKMNDATREEIMSIVARAQIRVHDYSGADETIATMNSMGYRSSAFLAGHSLRRQGKIGDAIPLLVEAVKERKAIRSAVHELALCYRREGSFAELKELLEKHSSLVADSAFFLDFQIGLDISSGRFAEAESKIANLSKLSDDNGRSGFREAQLLERRNEHHKAKLACSELLRMGTGVPPKIRSLRAVSAANSGDFSLADQDIEFLAKIPAWSKVADRCRALRYMAAGDLDQAGEILDGFATKSPEDWLLLARWMDQKAKHKATLITERDDLLTRAHEIRIRHRLHFDFDFDDDT